MKILKNTKKTALAVALASYFCYVPASNAIMLPSIDVAVLTETIAGNIQALRNWVEEKTMMRMGMDMESVNAAFGIDNENANAAKQIYSENEARADESRRTALINSKPTNNACKTLANQAMGAAVSCDAEQSLKKSTSASAGKRAGFSSTPTEVKEIEKAIIKETVDTCSLLQDEAVAAEYRQLRSQSIHGQGSAELKPADLLAMSKCLNPGLLVGTGLTESTFMPEDKVAAEHFKELIIGPVPTFKSSSLLDEKSDAYKKQAVNEARIEAFRNLAELTYSEAIAMRDGGTDGTNPSELFVLQNFSDERYGNKEWMSQIQNSDEPTKNEVQPPEVLRHIATMDAFMVHLDLIKYKQQLRMEALQAATLALMLDPPSK